MSPAIDALAEKYADRVVVGKYNIDEQTDLAMANRIMSIPTILFFKNGEQVKDLRMAGSQTLANLEAQVEKLLAL